MQPRRCRCRGLGAGPALPAAAGAGPAPLALAGLVAPRQLRVLSGGEGEVAGRIQRKILAALQAQGCLDGAEDARARLAALGETLKAHLTLL